MVTVNDVGKVINWEGCEGQQYGGAIMGAGRGHTEEVVHDPNTGVMLNGNLLNYKFPTMMDIGPIDTLLVETGNGIRALWHGRHRRRCGDGRPGAHRSGSL